MNIITFLSDMFSRYGSIFFFYLPLGIIGLWRWSVWLIRKIISFFYQMPKGNYITSLSVVTPVYNEDPALFQRALDSWAGNGIDEIIAVIDYTDEKNINVFREFANDFSSAKLIITEKPGKRPALADGIKEASGELVALVDSDVVWSPNIKDKLTGPFSDPGVGGLVTRQDVFRTNTLARKLFKILLDDRYLFEYPFLGASSDALLCLSGRTAVYRRQVVHDKLDLLVNETFWGKQMISGDDKTLTRLVQKDGWKTRYLRDVSVYTSGVANISSFMKQKLRWTRNGLRSDSKVLFSGWLWKRHPVLALHMLDKFISPLTLLISPAFFVLAIYFGHWQFALIILAWWLFSRMVKIFPHLREKPLDIFILPYYIIMTFVMAVVKLYALITIDEQGWITRWDKKRLSPVSFFRRAMSYGVTGMLIFGLFFAIFSYRNESLIVADAQKQRLADLKQAEKEKNLYAFMTPDRPRTSDGELAKIKTNLDGQRQDDPFGYYVVKAGDTIPDLKKRYNVPINGNILNARTKRPATFISVGQQLAIPVNDLRNPITKDVLNSAALAKPPRVTYDAPNNIIYVRQGGSVATLRKIKSALGPASRNLLVETAPGEWILRANLYIGQNVTLVLDGDEVKYLKLKSDPDQFVWIRSQSGMMLINNTKITSWNEKTSMPDIEHKNGRAYITTKSSGRMDIINSELAYLGYAGLPKRGGPFGGSYGVSWKNENQSFKDELLTGVITGSKFHHNYFGLYTFGATGLVISDNEFYQNDQYGIDPHDDSNNLLIINNRVYENGNHGIIISRRCYDNVIVGNISYGNKLHGIMIDRQSNNNLVEKNNVYGNIDGIVIYNSDYNLILENEVRDNIRGVRLNAGSRGNFIEKNTVTANDRGLYIYDQSRENILVDNGVKNNEIGITIKNATNNQLYDNFQKSDNKKDGRVTDDARENNIQ